MVKAVCFDLFHTLVDVGQAPDTPGRYTADILGVDREAWNTACFSDVHDICQPTDHREVVRAMAHSLDPAIPLERIHEAADERKGRFDYTLRNIQPDVLETLAELHHRGFKLALISNASSAEVESWPHSPLDEFFDAVVFSCECGHAKPDPAIYEYALQELDLEAGQCLFVGDGGSNEHAGASQLGMHTVLLTRWVSHRLGYAQMQQRRSYCRDEIAQLAELPPLIDRIVSRLGTM